MYYLSADPYPVINEGFVSYVGSYFIGIVNPILKRDLNIEPKIKREEMYEMRDYIKAHLLFGNILSSEYSEANYKSINRSLHYLLKRKANTYYLVHTDNVETYRKP